MYKSGFGLKIDYKAIQQQCNGKNEDKITHMSNYSIAVESDVLIYEDNKLGIFQQNGCHLSIFTCN